MPLPRARRRGGRPAGAAWAAAAAWVACAALCCSRAPLLACASPGGGGGGGGGARPLSASDALSAYESDARRGEALLLAAPFTRWAARPDSLCHRPLAPEQQASPPPPPRFAVLSLTAGLGEREKRALRHNRLLYCALHGCAYCEAQAAPDGSRAPAWAKLGLLRAALGTFDWALWADADAPFVDFGKDVRSRVMAEVEGADRSLAVAVWDTQAAGAAAGQGRVTPSLGAAAQAASAGDLARTGLNTGVMVARRCPWVQQALSEAYADHDPSQPDDWPWEQAAMWRLARRNASAWEGHVIELRGERRAAMGLQAFAMAPSARARPPHAEAPLAVHFAGMKNKWKKAAALGTKAAAAAAWRHRDRLWWTESV